MLRVSISRPCRFPDALKERRHLDGCPPQGAPAPFEAGEIEQVADDPLESMRFLHDNAEVLVAGRRVGGKIRHGEGFQIAAHGGQRRIQLVRYVSKKLTPGLVRRLKRVRACGKLLGHPIERTGECGHFVATVFGCAGAQVTLTQAFGGILQVPQPAMYGTKHHEGDQRDANRQDAAAHDAHGRTELANDA